MKMLRTTSRRTFARLMFSFEGSTFKNLYLENFTQKNKKSIVLMRCYGNEQKCSTSNQCELIMS